ncbi:hypothetical protein CAEBREN_31274 [Caenorhabditis brenneri]|uniref:Uncharacterized protein n=1 Tax=Caenorhabditis brenneri TaxID=135651 RepID=G0NT19_CAEBE|nr:hypothetical protein CAEBREN_31274 [Caenorhabditis brenneri]
MVLHQPRSRSSSRDSHDSQASSLGRQPNGHPQRDRRSVSKTNLRTAVVGPVKRHVTRLTKRAGELIKAARSAISTLQVLTPEQDGFQTYLEKTDELLVSIKRYAHRLGSLHNYVASRFDNPLMEASPERQQFLKEVRDKIVKSKAEILHKELQIIGGTIESQLISLKFQCSQYIPSDGLVSDEEETTGKSFTNAPRLFATARSIPASEATAKQSETGGLNPANAPSATGTGIELGTSSSVAETHILPMASRTYPERANQFESALESSSHQKDMEIRNLKAKLEEERNRRRDVESLAAKTEKDYFESYRRLQNTCLSDRATFAQARAEAAQSTTVTAHTQPETAPAAHTQPNVPSPSVDSVPNENGAAGHTQQPSPHPFEDAIKMMHQEKLKADASITAAMEKLTSFMSDWRRDQEEERYADEYERYAQGDGDDGHTHTPPPAHKTAETPKKVPVPFDAQYYRRFDATRHLSDYDGSGDLDVFQSTFEKVIMEDETLSDSDRYLLLRNTLKGKAANCLTHADEPHTAIRKTFTALARAFGHSQTENYLLGKLTKLPFHQTDPKQMRLDMVEITVVMERLKRKGILENDKRTIWDIAAKLPPAIQNDVTDYLAEHEHTVTHDSLVDVIFARIKALDMRTMIRDQGSQLASNEIPDSYDFINHVNASHSASAQAGSSYTRRPAPKTESFRSKGQRPLTYNADALPAEYVDPVTRQILPGYYTPGPRGAHVATLKRTFPSITPEFIKCQACDGPHNAMRCNLTSTEFREKLKEKDLCPICLGKHAITECRSSHKCGYCDGLHHMGACPKKEFYRIPANLPQGVKGRDTFFRGPQGHSSQ